MACKTDGGIRAGERKKTETRCARPVVRARTAFSDVRIGATRIFSSPETNVRRNPLPSKRRRRERPMFGRFAVFARPVDDFVVFHGFRAKPPSFPSTTDGKNGRHEPFPCGGGGATAGDSDEKLRRKNQTSTRRCVSTRPHVSRPVDAVFTVPRRVHDVRSLSDVVRRIGRRSARFVCRPDVGADVEGWTPL